MSEIPTYSRERQFKTKSTSAKPKSGQIVILLLFRKIMCHIFIFATFLPKFVSNETNFKTDQ